MEVRIGEAEEAEIGEVEDAAASASPKLAGNAADSGEGEPSPSPRPSLSLPSSLSPPPCTVSAFSSSSVNRTEPLPLLPNVPAPKLAIGVGTIGIPYPTSPNPLPASHPASAKVGEIGEITGETTGDPARDGEGDCAQPIPSAAYTPSAGLGSTKSRMEAMGAVRWFLRELRFPLVVFALVGVVLFSSE